jgi:fermentation-respiration switch protein FrsA (DUF1100 family)
LVPYRGYEGNAGSPREAALIEDGKAVVGLAHQKHSDVAVLGISVGTGVAVGVAAGVRVSRVALITPFDRLSAVIHDHAPWLPEWLVLDPFEGTRRARNIRVPTFVLQADRDEIVAPERTEGLLRAFPVRPQVSHVATTHNGVWNTPETCAWLRVALGEEMGPPASAAGVRPATKIRK